ncbi:MAG: 50S ribosomal protein L17, partial [Bacillota bacterium]|nr:50S ribosomal protein L17 [Bacillota bacterium]
KEVASLTEKMITLGKENTLHHKRLAMSFITKEEVVYKLFNEIAPKCSGRNSGYTRITKLGPRRGDAAEMAIIEIIDMKEPEKVDTDKKAKAKTTTKKAAEKAPAKKTAEKAPAKTTAKKTAEKAEKPAAKSSAKTTTKKTAEKPATAKKAKDTVEEKEDE